MKTIRYIPIFALTALLVTSCDMFSGNKAPSFSKEGDEVSYSDFKTRVQEAYEESEIFDTNARLGDRLEKISSSRSYVKTWKREKQEIEKTNSQLAMKGEAQYDADNLIAKLVSEMSYKDSSNTQEGKGSSTSESKTENYYQFSYIGGSKCLVNANAKTKRYSSYYPVYRGATEESVFDEVSRADMTQVYEQFVSTIPYSQSDAKEYLFYINGDSLFTFIQNTDRETSDSNVTSKTKIKLKVQLDLSDKKQAFRFSHEQQVEETYKKNYNGHIEGDVTVETTKNYNEYTFTAKNITVKEVNLDEYVLE